MSCSRSTGVRTRGIVPELRSGYRLARRHGAPGPDPSRWRSVDRSRARGAPGSLRQSPGPVACGTMSILREGGPEHAPDRGRHGAPATRFGGEVLPSPRRQLAVASPALVLRYTPFRPDEALGFEPLQGGVERPVLHEDHLVGTLLNRAGNALPACSRKSRVRRISRSRVPCWSARRSRSSLWVDTYPKVPCRPIWSTVVSTRRCYLPSLRPLPRDPPCAIASSSPPPRCLRPPRSLPRPGRLRVPADYKANGSRPRRRCSHPTGSGSPMASTG